MDTYLTIYNPFMSEQARLRQDLLVMFVLVVVSYVFDYYEIHNIDRRSQLLFYLTINIFFAILCTYFTFKSIQRLLQTGTSPTLRNLLSCRTFT